jgi:hypothetical protein
MLLCRISAVVAAGLTLLLPEPPVAAEGPGLRPLARQIPLVVIVRRPGLRTYEEVTEEFRGRVGGSVRVMPPEGEGGQSAAERIAALRPHLVFAVGQSAYEPLRRLQLPVIVALAYHRVSPTHVILPGHPPAEQVLRAFRLARPQLRTVGVLHSPDAAGYIETARAAAQQLGISLQSLLCSTPERAISRLRTVGSVQGLWLLADVNVLHPQVFQYALGLQFRRRVPLMGATRRHVAQGALFALDYAPGALGQQAAVAANQILAGLDPQSTSFTVQPRLSLNLSSARRIGADLAALHHHAVEVFQ